MIACYHISHILKTGKGFPLVLYGCLVTRHADYVSICEIQISSTEDHFSPDYATLLKQSGAKPVKVTIYVYHLNKLKLCIFNSDFEVRLSKVTYLGFI